MLAGAPGATEAGESTGVAELAGATELAGAAVVAAGAVVAGAVVAGALDVEALDVEALEAGALEAGAEVVVDDVFEATLVETLVVMAEGGLIRDVETTTGAAAEVETLAEAEDEL